MTDTIETMSDAHVAEFLDLAASAGIHFGMFGDQLIMHAAKLNWRVWRTHRHLLDEIGTQRIAAYLRDCGCGSLTRSDEPNLWFPAPAGSDSSLRAFGLCQAGASLNAT